MLRKMVYLVLFFATNTAFSKDVAKIYKQNGCTVFINSLRLNVGDRLEVNISDSDPIFLAVKKIQGNRAGAIVESLTNCDDLNLKGAEVKLVGAKEETASIEEPGDSASMRKKYKAFGLGLTGSAGYSRITQTYLRTIETNKLKSADTDTKPFSGFAVETALRPYFTIAKNLNFGVMVGLDYFRGTQTDQIGNENTKITIDVTDNFTDLLAGLFLESDSCGEKGLRCVIGGTFAYTFSAYERVKVTGGSSVKTKENVRSLLKRELFRATFFRYGLFVEFCSDITSNMFLGLRGLYNTLTTNVYVTSEGKEKHIVRMLSDYYVFGLIFGYNIR